MTENKGEFDTEKIVAFWLTEADEALEVASHLVEKGDYSTRCSLVILPLKSC
jgi:HEPN domain-containing protein